MQFTATQNFSDSDLRSEYVAGMSYTVREGNALLAEKLKGWLQEGKVILGTVTPAVRAEVEGSGTVEGEAP